MWTPEDRIADPRGIPARSRMEVMAKMARPAVARRRGGADPPVRTPGGCRRGLPPPPDRGTAREAEELLQDTLLPVVPGHEGRGRDAEAGVRELIDHPGS